METLLVITNCPDESTADTITQHLIEARLAACVNRLPPVRSTYRWQGKIESATEIPLFIKSTAAHYAALETLIRAHHPYALPEIIALPITRGLPAYLDWVVTETTP